jgi:hypothetical protein
MVGIKPAPAKAMIHITLRGDPGLTNRHDRPRRRHTRNRDLAQTGRRRGSRDHGQGATGDAGPVRWRGGHYHRAVFRFISGATWNGTTMTGQTMAGVSDPEMARMFPGCSWGEGGLRMISRYWQGGLSRKLNTTRNLLSCAPRNARIAACGPALLVWPQARRDARKVVLGKEWK